MTKAPKGVDRRRAIGGVLGTLSAAIAAPLPALALSDRPPPLVTARHQFTILRPANTAPNIRLNRVNGSIDDLQSFKGKVVLANFWATWCTACRTELPQLNELQQRMGRARLQVMAISLDRQGRSVVLPFLHSLEIRHLDVYLDPDGLIARPGDHDGVPFQLYGMPITYLIGPTQTIEGYIVGQVDWSSEEAARLISYYASSSEPR